MALARGVPAPATALLGRARELAAVDRLLADPDTRLVTLTGPPGVGKTRLALAVARAGAERFADGVVWVDLAPLRDARAVTAEIARGLGVGRADDALGLPRLLAATAERQVLLVLDNCEHLLAAAPELGALLAHSPGVRILATSRERLRLAAEHEFVVPPLPVPEADADLAALGANPAVGLLVARAPAAVTLTPNSAPALADICVRLDGLPLAIELAAARLRVFTPAELAFRLERPMTVLTAGAADAPERHHGLRAAVAWSHGLLTDLDRAVFRRLSVFVGDFTLAAAEQVCGEDGRVVDAVESLLDKSLVRRADGDDGEARFGLLASLREFGADQLEQCGEAAATRLRHARYFADVARGWEAAVGTDDEAAVLPRLGRARGDLVAAYETCRAVGDVEASLWIAAGLGWLGYTHGSLADAADLVADVSVGVPALTAQTPAAAEVPEAVAAALLACGVVGLGLGDLDVAGGLLQRAVTAAATRGDERRLAIGNAFLGHVARDRGDVAEASTRYAVARETYARLGSARGTAWAAHDLGLLADVTGDADRAQVLLRESLRLFRGTDYDWAVAVSAGALAGVLLRGGSAGDDAAALLGESLRLHDEVGDRRGVAQALEGLAELALSRGAASTAARLRGAAAARRDSVAAPPTEAERDRLARLDAALAQVLGPGGAAREQQAGRRTAPAAAIELGAGIAAQTGPAAVVDLDLTPRQREVSALIAAGCTNRQIGRELGISEKTAEVHVRNIMERLQTPSRAGVAAWAVSHGLSRTPAYDGPPTP